MVIPCVWSFTEVRVACRFVCCQSLAQGSTWVFLTSGSESAALCSSLTLQLDSVLGVFSAICSCTVLVICSCALFCVCLDLLFLKDFRPTWQGKEGLAEQVVREQVLLSKSFIILCCFLSLCSFTKPDCRAAGQLSRTGLKYTRIPKTYLLQERGAKLRGKT